MRPWQSYSATVDRVCEAPRLLLYKDRKAFAVTFRLLETKECAAVVRRLRSLLATRYGQLAPSAESRRKEN
jgi:hypothetical protein